MLPVSESLRHALYRSSCVIRHASIFNARTQIFPLHQLFTTSSRDTLENFNCSDRESKSERKHQRLAAIAVEEEQRRQIAELQAAAVAADRAKYANIELGAARVLIVQAPLLTSVLQPEQAKDLQADLESDSELEESVTNLELSRTNEGIRKLEDDKITFLNRQNSESRYRNAEREHRLRFLQANPYSDKALEILRKNLLTAVESARQSVADHHISSREVEEGNTRQNIASALVPQVLSAAIAVGFTITNMTTVSSPSIVHTWTLTRTSSEMLTTDQMHHLRQHIGQALEMRTWTKRTKGDFTSDTAEQRLIRILIA